MKKTNGWDVLKTILVIIGIFVIGNIALFYGLIFRMMAG